MENNKIIKVTNRGVGSLSYTLPELHVQRDFTPRETKEITFEELKALSFIPGGMAVIEQNLAVKDKEALKAINVEVEPEYFYDEDAIKRIMTTGSLDEFLDLLDFAPDGVLEIVKNLSVNMPLNDVGKRDAILEKLNFNVTKAIEIQNTKFDGGDEDGSAKAGSKSRRVAIKEEPTEEQNTSAATPKRRVVNIKE